MLARHPSYAESQKEDLFQITYKQLEVLNNWPFTVNYCAKKFCLSTGQLTTP